MWDFIRKWEDCGMLPAVKIFLENFWDGINDTTGAVYPLWSITMGFVKNDKLLFSCRGKVTITSKIDKPDIIFYESPVVGYKYKESDMFIKSIIPT